MAELKRELATAEHSVPHSWAISRMNIETLKFHWKIENYSYWDKNNEEYICSPIFYKENSETKFQMRLYPPRNRCTPPEANTLASHRFPVDQVNKPNLGALKLLMVYSKESSIQAKCKFSILDYNGSVLDEFIPEDFHTFKKNLSSALQINNILADSNICNDNFIIMCQISMCRGGVYIQSPPHPHTYGLENSKKTRQDDFEELLSSGRLSDVTLLLQNAGKSIPAHKSILAARSSVFAEMFEAQVRDSMQTYNINVVEVEEQVLQELLRYVYADRVENIEDIAVQLLEAADRYKIEGLKQLCESALIDKLAGDNAVDYLELAKQYDLENLKRKAVNFLALTKSNPLVWIDTEDVVCSESPDHLAKLGTVQKFKGIVKKQILDRLSL